MDALLIEGPPAPICAERIGAVLESRLRHRLRALSYKSGQLYEHVLADAISQGWEYMQEWNPALTSFEQRLVFWCQKWILEQLRASYHMDAREKLVRVEKLESMPASAGPNLRPARQPVQDMVRTVGAIEEWHLLLTTLGDLTELQRAALLAPGTGDTDDELAERFHRSPSTVRSARREARRLIAELGYSFEV